MRVKTVSARYSQKFNLGNYESFEVDVFLAADIDHDEPESACIEYLIQQGRESVVNAAQKITEAHNVDHPTIKKFYMGKEIDKLPSEVEAEKVPYPVDLPFLPVDASSDDPVDDSSDDDDCPF